MEQIRKYTNQPNIIDYLIVLFIIAATGFEWCFRYNEMIFCWVFPLALILYLRRKPKFSVGFISFMAIFSVWALIQAEAGITAISALINFGIRLIIYYLAVISIRDLPTVIIKIVYYICIVSIIMYFLCAFAPIRDLFRSIFANIKPIGGFEEGEITSNPGNGFIFYFLPRTLWEKTFRNCGPFWEPGMFGVFINIALAMQLIRDRKLTKESFVFLIASVTSFSTTSVLASILILCFLFTFVRVRTSSIFMVLLLGVGFMMFLNSDFGLEKIQNDASNSETYSRFGAILYHISLIARHPILGNGYDQTLDIAMSPNGLSFAVVFWGIPMSVLYYILLYKGIRNLTLDLGTTRNMYSVFLFVVFLIVVFSQDTTNRHFYLAIMMYGLYKPICIKHNNCINP